MNEEPTNVDSSLEADVFNKVIDEMNRLSPEGQKKILKMTAIFYGIEIGSTSFDQSFKNIPSQSINLGQRPTSFSEDRTWSAKEFLLYKSPQTDVERVACLAYYLTHYRNQEQFKTVDISALNTEAAQLKFSNATTALDNATKQNHFLIQGNKGFKKISYLGELYVQALPDREKAKEAISRTRNKKVSKKNDTSLQEGNQ